MKMNKTIVAVERERERELQFKERKNNNRTQKTGQSLSINRKID